MRIPVPHSDSFPLVSIILFTPKGEFTTTLDDSHYWVDIPLPKGVQEDEVDVYSCFLGADHRPPFGCGPALLKAATRKPESAPAPAVESAPVVEPAPVAPAQEPEPVSEPESAPASEPAPAVEPEADADDEPAPADEPAPVESDSPGD
jgi:hypothetical protein